jgi:uncharacterized protein (TIGR02996 family)
MEDNPANSASRFAYADWLDDQGRTEEGLHHRIIGMSLPHSRAARQYVYDEMAGGRVVPFSAEPGGLHNPLYAYTPKYGKAGGDYVPLGYARRRSTPLEASLQAVRAGNATQANSNESGRTAHVLDNAARYYAITGSQKVGVSMPQAMRLHEAAALAHLQAARDLDYEDNPLAVHHRTAALAHIIAAHVHRQAQGLWGMT